MESGSAHDRGLLLDAPGEQHGQLVGQEIEIDRILAEPVIEPDDELGAERASPDHDRIDATHVPASVLCEHVAQAIQVSLHRLGIELASTSDLGEQRDRLQAGVVDEEFQAAAMVESGYDEYRSK